eukprot:GDKK01057582.1.p1 GENE.GDKK01057582.1~~GDKK01057582.1.p1  ORF type:complete len:127 (-),score=5.08 GDKK01057582.1:81-461(-)
MGCTSSTTDQQTKKTKPSTSQFVANPDIGLGYTPGDSKPSNALEREANDGQATGKAVVGPQQNGTTTTTNATNGVSGTTTDTAECEQVNIGPDAFGDTCPPTNTNANAKAIDHFMHDEESVIVHSQ